MTKIFPSTLIFLDICAAVVYLFNGDIRHFIYWIAAATNAFDLYDTAFKDWSKIDTSKLTYKQWDESWKDIPTEMLEYIKSLPEFDSDIFKEITGVDIAEQVEEMTVEQVCKALGKNIKIIK